MKWFRCPKTNNERRKSVNDPELMQYKIKIRPRYLPSNWDDLWIHIEKSWKHKKKKGKQYNEK